MNTSPRSKRWKVAEPIPLAGVQALAAYNPTLRQMIYNRGCRTGAEAQAYLEAHPPAGSSALALLGMAEATARIRFAIQQRQPIAIYGDYDVDGVTATALLTEALGGLGADVRGYIPNRFEEGYGLNNEALDALKKSGIGLVITVDCGVRSLPEAAFARQIGLDMIITDHHSPGDELPPAVCVINPKQIGDEYPDKELAGVGLAHKLAEALYGEHAPAIEDGLDLVALGTVADLVPLRGENRSLVRRGLYRLRNSSRQGLFSLINAAGLTPAAITATNIGYSLGPRLNAAGRLDSALAALELLTTREPARAGLLAQQLDNQNRERQRISQEIQQQAEIIALAEDPEALILFAVDPSFNVGVVGLAASRLTERFYRPAVVACQGAEFTRASCRSIPEFHITEALDQCGDLLEHYGGHAAAAGFTVRNSNLPELVERLRQIARQELASLDLRKTLKADLEIPLTDLRPAVLDDLKWLEPTGQANPRAVFVSRDLKIRRAQTVGRDQSHLKLDVTDGAITFSAIAFSLGHWLDNLPDSIDLMYQFELNEFNGRSSLQLNVIDLKPAGTSD